MREEADGSKCTLLAITACCVLALKCTGRDEEHVSWGAPVLTVYTHTHTRWEEHIKTYKRQYRDGSWGATVLTVYTHTHTQDGRNT